MKKCLLMTAFILAGSIGRSLANSAPEAADITALTEPAVDVTITLAATDPDEDDISYVVVTLPSAGTVQVDGTALTSDDLPYTIPDGGAELVYTSAASTHGVVTFTYKANDGTVDSAAATVSITVNTAPGATDVEVVTEPDTETDITLGGQDADEDDLTFTIVSLPGHGVLTVGGTPLGPADLPYALESGEDEVTYEPDPAYHGPDQFVFRSADEWEESDEAVVTIQVNTRPEAQGLSIYAEPGVSRTVTLCAQDADRDPLTYILLSLPAHGTLSCDGAQITEDDLPYVLPDQGLSVVYTANAAYLGTDSFHYWVSDGVEFSGLGVVAIAMNHPPAGTTISTTADADGRASVVLCPSDADGDALTIVLATLPAHGQVSVLDEVVTAAGQSWEVDSDGLAVAFEAAYEYAGSDGFTWTVSDGKETSGPFQVSIEIPVAVPTPATEPTESPDPEATDGGSTSDAGSARDPRVDPCGDMTAELLGLAGITGLSLVSRRRTAA